MKIFVNIVSYRDILLWDTINDCIDNCSDPSRLHFGIVDQSDSAYDVKNHRLNKQITYFHMDPQYSRGPCWARSMAYSFYVDEDYVLQVDAHTVFDKNWDVHLIKQLEELEGKCLLSSYPPEFEFVDGMIKKHNKQGVATVFRPKDDAEITDDDPSFSFKGYFVKSDRSIQGFHVAGGFLFAPGTFVHEIPYDPSLYFIGEEQNLAVRAWTHGWNIYHPIIVPVYHLYHSKAQRPLHWDKAEDEDRPVRWYELRERSRKRLGDLLLRNKELGIYGLGKVRTLEQFADFSGIDYPNRTIAILKI